MRGIIVLLVVVFAALHPSLTRAQASTDAVSAPRPQLLHQGDRAPFEGELILQADLLRWTMQIEALRHQLQLDATTATATCDVRLSLEQARTLAASDRTTLHDGLYEARIQELVASLAEARHASERGWWEHPALWFAIGAVVAIVGVVVTVVAVH